MRTPTAGDASCISHRVARRRLAGGSRIDGDPPANHRRLAVRPASPGDVRAVRAAAARPDRPVLALPLERRRSGDVGRSEELRRRSSANPTCSRRIVQRVRAGRLLQPHPGRARPGRRDVIHRVATGRLGAMCPDRPVPAAGHPAGRRRHHLGLAAVPTGLDQPDPDRGRPRRRHPRLARRLRLRAAGRRPHRHLGAARVLHRAAADRHDARSTRLCTSRRGIDGAGWFAEFRSDHACPACATRSACASPSRSSPRSRPSTSCTSRPAGGPGNATAVPGIQIYILAFLERQVGLASALAVVLIILVLDRASCRSSA